MGTSRIFPARLTLLALLSLLASCGRPVQSTAPHQPGGVGKEWFTELAGPWGAPLDKQAKADAKAR